MKLISVFGLGLFAFIFAGPAAVDSYYYCQGSGLEENPNDAANCEQYYMCYGAGDIGYGPYTCQSGLLFNWVANVCDHAVDVYCGDEPCDNGQGSPVDDGNYEHPDNCRKFLMCSNGRATFMDCAGGIFNPTTGDCDITDNGQNCPA